MVLLCLGKIMSNNKRQLAKRFGWAIVIFLILLIACAKKKPIESERTYMITAEEIDFPEDDELDDLPEAGEDTNEDY